jgi:AcrR family transcriptional regulator
VTDVTTVQRRHPGAVDVAGDDDTSAFRCRLLDGLAESIAEVGYRRTTVADIVRRAQTSRRTFYEHFTSREACFVALIAASNMEMVEQISTAVDPSTPWEVQVRQAIEAWIARAEIRQAMTLSWIRDVPSLGDLARQLQRDMIEAFVAMIQKLCDTDEWRAASGGGVVSRQMAIVLLGGLMELTANTVEHGGRIGDVTEAAVQAAIVLLRAQPR